MPILPVERRCRCVCHQWRYHSLARGHFLRCRRGRACPCILWQDVFIENDYSVVRGCRHPWHSYAAGYITVQNKTVTMAPGLVGDASLIARNMTVYQYDQRLTVCRSQERFHGNLTRSNRAVSKAAIMAQNGKVISHNTMPITVVTFLRSSSSRGWPPPYDITNRGRWIGMVESCTG